MAKETKTKKQQPQPEELKETPKEIKDVIYHQSIGIRFAKRDYQVIISEIGSDGSSKVLETYDTEDRSTALEVFKIWAITRVYDRVINLS
jgi:hypothetical protein